MASLTVDQLKSALVSRSIDLPPSNAKKSEYIRLYQKHVAPLKNIRVIENQFSSDDDDDVVVTKVVRTQYQRQSKETANMSDLSLTVDGVDVTTMGDDELYEKLTSLGATVGPIVDSTRRVYQKKLFGLMGGDIVDSPYNGEVDAEDYSDSEENITENQAKGTERFTLNTSSTRTTKTTKQPSLQATDIRKRYFEQDVSDKGSLLNSLSFDHDRHTPSPRPSLRTVTSSSSSTTTTKYTSPLLGNIRETKFIRHTYSTPTKSVDESKQSYYLRLLVKILFIIILLASMYFIYEYMYSESPFKGIENLARQALDSSQAKSEGEKKVPAAKPK